MTKPLSILGISSALALAVLGLIYYPEIKESFTHSKLSALNEESDEQQVSLYLAQGRALEALPIIKKYQASIIQGNSSGQKWLNYLIRASENLNDTPQLVSIFNFYPRSLDSHEKGALLVANQLIANGDIENYELLRTGFKGKEALLSLWFNLDADKLVLQGKTQEAIDLLSSRYFEGKEDTGRLLRLALLNINDHPKIAWDYLDQALKKDPNNSDLRIYRARWLDSSNKKPQALQEYITAIKSHPMSAELRDQAIDFLIRQKEFDEALRLSSESLTSPTNSSLWTKAIFLNKAYKPSSPLVKNKKAPKSDLVIYLLSLNPDEFWNDAKFKSLAVNEEVLQTEQATFWLRVLQNLKEGREKDALTLLNFNPFEKDLWNPELALALKRILTFRTKGSLKLDEEEPAQTTSSLVINPFFSHLNALATKNDPLSDEEANLLKSNIALSLPFLAAQLNEAALNLYPKQTLPDISPSWVHYKMTQAYLKNQGVKEAIQFAEKQPKTALLNLTLAELYIESKKIDEAQKILSDLASRNDEIGEKSAYLLSLIYLDEDKADTARSLILGNSRLKESTQGKEVIAKTYLKQNNPDEAFKIYSGIEESSVEAKSYLAKNAFLERNYKRALELTEELLKLNPESPTLIENKARILNELKK